MAQDTKSVWPAALVVSVVLLAALCWGFSSVNSNLKQLDTPVEVDYSVLASANDIQVVSDKITALEDKLAVTDNDKLDYLYTKQSEEDVIEAKVLGLATDYVNSRDFKKLVYDAFLVCTDEKCSVDSYKDISLVKLDETEVSQVGHTDTYEVEFSKVKVYYFVDGDDEETEKALLDTFVITVKNVDYDEDFEDTEVDETALPTLVIEKVY